MFPPSSVKFVGLDNGPAARDQLEYQRYHCEHKQDVNETAEGVAADDSYEPKNEQNDKQSPKHE